MSHRKREHRRKNRFRKHNFRFKPVSPFNRIPVTFNKKPEKKINYINLWNNISLRYRLFFVLLVLNFLIYFIFNQIFFYMIVLNILFVIIWMWGMANNCPRCKSHWARKLIDRHYFGTHTKFENFTKNVTHRDSNGNLIGTSSIKDNRPVTISKVQNHWVCKYCRHHWSGKIHDIRE